MNFNFIIFPKPTSSQKHETGKLHFFIRNFQPDKKVPEEQGQDQDDTIEIEGSLFQIPSVQKGQSDYIPMHLIPAKQGSRKFMFYLHANAEDIGFAHRSLLFLNSGNGLNVNFISVEQPGYGTYDKYSPTENHIVHNALKAYDWVKDYFNVEDSDIMIMGRSIGTGVAVQLAALRNPKALVLISPFTSIKDVAKHLFGNVSCVVKERFKSVEFARQVNCPTLIIHGKLDTLIPQTQGEELARIIPQAHFECPPMMDHNRMSLNEIKILIRKFMTDHDLYSKDPEWKHLGVAEEFWDFKVNESSFCCIPIGCIRAMKWKKDKDPKNEYSENIVNNKI